MKTIRIWLAVFVPLLVAAIAIACAPVFPKAVFVYARHPDFPRTEYLSGKLGIFEPGYARSYLVIAYRYLNGPGLNAVEREQVRDYWKDRETGDWDNTATDWVTRWEQARLRVHGAKPEKRNQATQGRYRFDHRDNAFFLNCAEDAYRTAYRTLESRGARFGFRSAAVRSWLDAQDAVFSNCDDQPRVPSPADAALPSLIRADREYQIAAANFYAGHYPEAIAQFRTIAAEASSPWSGIAPYLVVRTMDRAYATPTERPKAEAAARELLKNPKLAPLHGMTRVLLHRMILKDAGENYFHEVARDLISGRQDRSMREELWVYTTLFDDYVGYSPWERWEEKKEPIDEAIFARDDLSDWIFTFQGKSSGAARHAMDRWRQRRTLPWLIAALHYATPSSPNVDELMAAASRVEPGSPGYVIANFYRLSLMVDSGQKAEARAELDRMLTRPMPKSTVNRFRSLRMRAAPDMTGFLRFAARKPVMLTTDWNIGEVPPFPSPDDDAWERALFARAIGKQLLDRDSIKILNERTPIRLLRQAALSGDVPPYAGRDFVLSVFTRALLLDDKENGLPLAAKLKAIGADKEDYLATYEQAENEDDRRFAGIFYILHHPESRPYLSSAIGRMGRPNQIDDYRDNWWCPVDIVVELDARTNWSYYSGLLPKRENPESAAWSAAFVTDADRKEAAQEITKLAATASGPDYLIAQTMRYARAHIKDPRVPEALHCALRSQRYGCVRKQTAAAAEAAWRYLWRHYPKSVWARKSNYSFEGENLPKIER